MSIKALSVRFPTKKNCLSLIGTSIQELLAYSFKDVKKASLCKKRGIYLSVKTTTTCPEFSFAIYVLQVVSKFKNVLQHQRIGAHINQEQLKIGGIYIDNYIFTSKKAIICAEAATLSRACNIQGKVVIWRVIFSISDLRRGKKSPRNSMFA